MVAVIQCSLLLLCPWLHVYSQKPECKTFKALSLLTLNSKPLKSQFNRTLISSLVQFEPFKERFVRSPLVPNVPANSKVSAKVGFTRRDREGILIFKAPEWGFNK